MTYQVPPQQPPASAGLTAHGYLGSVSFDGAFVTIAKKLRGAVRIPIQSLASINIENAGIGMMGIRFVTGGAMATGRQRGFGRHKDVARDPNALTFMVNRLSDFQNFARTVEAAIVAASGQGAWNQHQPTLPPAAWLSATGDTPGMERWWDGTAWTNFTRQTQS